LIPRAGSNQRL